MQKNTSLSYQIGDIKINPYVIQVAHDQAKSQNRIPDMLRNTFGVLQLAQKNETQPQKHVPEIRKIMESGMLEPPNSDSSRNSIRFDPNAVYPLTKQGSLGALVRKCQITNQGLQEKQGNEKPKVKQLTGFINKIETFNASNKPKLQWIKDSKKYPYRIVVEGTKKEQKAIYFETKAQSEAVRIHLVNRFNYKGRISKFTPDLKAIYQNALLAAFNNKLKEKREDMRKRAKSQRKSKMLEDKSSFLHNNEAPSSASQANYSQVRQKIDPVSLFKRGSTSKSQQGYDTQMMNFLIDKEDRMSSHTQTKKKFNFGSVLKLEKTYKKNFFSLWQQMTQSTYRGSFQKDKSRISSIREVSERGQKSGSKRLSMKTSPKKTEKRAPTLSFCNIQFLRLTNILLKPIVNIAIFRNGNMESEIIFNTCIRSRDPHLSYELAIKVGKQTLELVGDAKDYQIHIKTIDYLTNEVLCNEQISLKNKVLSEYTLLTNEAKDIRLQMKYNQGHHRRDHENVVKIEENPDGNFLLIQPLNPTIVEQIRKQWEQEAVRRGLFEAKKEIKLIQILQKLQEFPPSWAGGLNEEEYKVVQLLNTASKILKFKLIPSVLPIISVLLKFYSQADELMEAALSLITNHLKHLYFPEYFTRLQKHHEELGLDGQIQFSSKISLQMAMIKKLVEVECPKLALAFARKNIAYAQTIYQSIYEFYSKEFPVKTLAELWNFCFQDHNLIPVYGLLIGVWLMKFYEKKLVNCDTMADFMKVLQSHQTCPPEAIIKNILILREKYFTHSKVAKNRLQNRVLEEVVIDFFRQETQKIDTRKEKRVAEKNVALEKLKREVPMVILPKYPPKSYCLHLYFYQLPNVPGSLYIKANGIEYECRDHNNNRYFIIDEVSTQTIIQFVNNKSDQFTAELICMQGVGRYQVELKSPKDKNVYKVDYLCGLLSDSQIELIKKNRRFEHLISSFGKKENFLDSLVRSTNQSYFLNTTALKLERDDLGKRIKVIFSSVNKSFDEVDFYIRWIAQSSLTFSQKMNLIKNYGSNLSKEINLCTNQQINKILLFYFLEVMEFPITQAEFDCFYNGSLSSDLQGCRILKCRLVLPNGDYHEVEHAANKYLSDKSTHFVNSDLLLHELLQAVKESLENQLSTISQGLLEVLLCRNGVVKSIQYPIVRKKTNKQLAIDESRIEVVENPDLIQSARPIILTTEIMPAMQKKTSIMNFIDGAKSVDFNDRVSSPTKKAADNLNILFTCDEKLKKVILMRHNYHPEQLKIPFFHLYHDLVFSSQKPSVPKNLFLNNTRVGLKPLLTSEFTLTFSDNKRMDPQLFKVQNGFYMNFRWIDPKTDSLYFTTAPQAQQINTSNAVTFVNYGFGIYRWEPCFVKGFIEKKKDDGKKQPKRIYSIIHRNIELLVKDSQIKMEEEVMEDLEELNIKPKVGSIKKPKSESKKLDLPKMMNI